MTSLRRILGLALILCLGLLTSCQPQRPIHVEAPDLVQVALAGKDGQGTVSATLTPSGRERILGLTGENPPSEEILAERQALADQITFSFSPEHGLKENDRVTVQMHTEPAAWAETGIDLKVFPWTVTVHDLAPLDPPR